MGYIMINAYGVIEESIHEKRIRYKNNRIEKQIRIAKENNISVSTPHKWHKRNATNCGNSRCIFCSNPRRIWNQKTMQEKKFLQDKGEL